MGMVQCDRKLHFYDVDAYPSCPFCAEQFGDGAAAAAPAPQPTPAPAPAPTPAPAPVAGSTTPVGAGLNGSGGHHKTQPIGASGVDKTTPVGAGVDTTKPINNGNQNSSGSQTKTGIITGGSGSASSSSSTPSTEDTLPVAGWLVITGGPGRGRDFRLIQGENRIGRAPEMEVCLDFGADSDNTVSRESHAVVVYDNNANGFFIERGASRNLPTVNGNTVRRDQDMEAYDLIQLGETQLMFFPLCGDKFKW